MSFRATSLIFVEAKLVYCGMGTHLLVLQHGLHGSNEDFSNMCLKLEETYNQYVVVSGTKIYVSDQK